MAVLGGLNRSWCVSVPGTRRTQKRRISAGWPVACDIHSFSLSLSRAVLSFQLRHCLTDSNENKKIYIYNRILNTSTANAVRRCALRVYVLCLFSCIRAIHIFSFVYAGKEKYYARHTHTHMHKIQRIERDRCAAWKRPEILPRRAHCRIFHTQSV